MVQFALDRQAAAASAAAAVFSSDARSSRSKQQQQSRAEWQRENELLVASVSIIGSYRHLL
jgi:hypothetical protein